MESPRLVDLIVYPLKGASGVSVSEWPVDAFGLYLDRRWMITDTDGRFLSQRKYTRLALIGVDATLERVVVSAPGMPDLLLPHAEDPASRGSSVDVVVEGDLVPDAAWHEEESEWFADFLQVSARLVSMPERAVRWANPAYVAEQRVAFTNSYPIHLTSIESLAELNGRLPSPVEMSRFRPNLVVEGLTGPYEEDLWRSVRIGDLVLDVVKPCGHQCGVPNVDQETGERGVEPLRTLATYRRHDGNICFGQNLAQRGPGVLRRGKPVEVLETGPARPPL